MIVILKLSDRVNYPQTRKYLPYTGLEPGTQGRFRQAHEQQVKLPGIFFMVTEHERQENRISSAELHTAVEEELYMYRVSQ